MLFNYLVAWLLFYVSSFQPFFLLSDQTRFVFSIYSRNYNSRRLSSLWGVGIMFLLLVLWHFVVVVVRVLIVITSFFTFLFIRFFLFISRFFFFFSWFFLFFIRFFPM